MRKIITTVGTSIFTNLLKEEYVHDRKTDIKDDYKLLETKPTTEWKNKSEDIGTLRDNVNEVLCECKKSDDSAEIESILAIVKESKENEENIEIYLLATDTVLSLLACLLIQDWFKDKPQFSFKVVKKGGEVEDLTEENKDLLVVEDLRIVSDSSSTSGNEINSDTINSGFLNLIDKIQAIIKPDKKRNSDDLILNISGGYKAFIPILTIMGQLYNIPLKYIYEGSKQLVEIGLFPLHFDWDLAEQYYPHLNDRLLKEDEYINNNKELVDKLKRDLLIIYNKTRSVYQITALGKLLKDYVDSEMPHAHSVAGFIAEYKVFEYFCKYPYQKLYSQVERSLGVGNEEIDIKLCSPKREVVICEVKAFRGIYGNLDKIVKRAKARIEIYQKNKEDVRGYVLVIHKGSFDRIELISNNLKKISNDIHESQPNVVFRIFYMERPNSYQEFARRPLNEDELKEYAL